MDEERDITTPLSAPGRSLSVPGLPQSVPDPLAPSPPPVPPPGLSQSLVQPPLTPVVPPPPSTGLPALRPLPEAGSLPSSEALQSSPSSPEERPRKSGILRLVLEFAIVLCIAFGVTWLVRTFVIQIFEVPSASMEPTIMTGDKFAADMLFFKIDGVKPGEIVCFNDKIQPGRILVKRVIAVGGQTVDLQNGRVVVDGVTLFEPYTQHKLTEPLPSQYQDMTITYPYTVPEGSIWVMGDNRTSSADSRYFGVIQESEVLGHALFVFWPFEDIGMLQ